MIIIRESVASAKVLTNVSKVVGGGLKRLGNPIGENRENHSPFQFSSLQFAYIISAMYYLCMVRSSSNILDVACV